MSENLLVETQATVEILGLIAPQRQPRYVIRALRIALDRVRKTPPPPHLQTLDLSTFRRDVGADVLGRLRRGFVLQVRWEDEGQLILVQSSASFLEFAVIGKGKGPSPDLSETIAW